MWFVEHFKAVLNRSENTNWMQCAEILMQNTLAKLDENQLCGGVEQAYMLYLFSDMPIIDIDIAYVY